MAESRREHLYAMMGLGALAFAGVGIAAANGILTPSEAWAILQDEVRLRQISSSSDQEELRWVMHLLRQRLRAGVSLEPRLPGISGRSEGEKGRRRYLVRPEGDIIRTNIVLPLSEKITWKLEMDTGITPSYTQMDAAEEVVLGYKVSRYKFAIVTPSYNPALRSSTIYAYKISETLVRTDLKLPEVGTRVYLV